MSFNIRLFMEVPWLIVSPENATLNKIEIKAFIDFESKFQYILAYNLLATILWKNIKK